MFDVSRRRRRDYKYANGATSKLKLLVKCANLVIKEIAAEYVPLIEEETVRVVDSKISFEGYAQNRRGT